MEKFLEFLLVIFIASVRKCNRFLCINFLIYSITKFIDEFWYTLVAYLGSSIYSIMSSANSDSLNYFPIWTSFTSFYSLIVVARTSKTMINKCGKSGYSCLVLNLWGNDFNFSHQVWRYCRFVIIAFIILRYVLYAHFLERFFCLTISLVLFSHSVMSDS